MDPTVPVRSAILKRALIDPREVWGSNGMSLWVPFADQWRDRLLQGNGLDDPGNLLPDGLLRLRGIDPYSQMVAQLRTRFEVLVFAYDWRLSIHVSARRLRERVIQWLGNDLEDPNDDARVSVVAHSMGGLVARMLVEGADGYRWIRQLIMVGTPHLGSVTAYTHFHGITQSFAQRVDLTSAKWLLQMIWERGARALPRRVILPLLLPRAHQRVLAQSWAGGMQMLPQFDFVRRGDGFEPLTDTLDGMLHPPTQTPIRQIMDLLLRGLRDERKLNAWLTQVGVRYETIAATELPTLQAFDPNSLALIKTSAGDGVVPLHSAHLPPGCAIGNVTETGVVHQRLLENARLQAHVVRHLTTQRSVTR